MTLQETLSQLNWGGEGYASYDGFAYMTGPETSGWNQLGFEIADLYNKYNLQFKEQQAVLGFLTTNLQSMATNPPGFGGPALAAIKSSAIGTIGAQLANQTQSLQNQFATENMAGLGSGPLMGIMAGLRQGAAGQEAQAMQGIAIANAQQQVQQQQYALSQLQGVAGQYGQGAMGTAELAGKLTDTEQTTAKGFYGQQSPTSALLGSLADVALTVGGGLIAGPAGAAIGSEIGGAISGAGKAGASASPGGTIASNWGNWGLPSIWGGGTGITQADLTALQGPAVGPNLGLNPFPTPSVPGGLFPFAPGM